MILIFEALLVHNCVRAISEVLRKIEIGGMTVSKVRGRGKHPPAKLHAAKGSEIFRPQFSDKYIMIIIIPESKDDAVINILKTKGTGGKIFVSPILRATDITTGREGEGTI